ncbi:hypothetical protein C8R47DRAFT_1032468 [Mycena vitilis]|nr:hypothetical protein C8R47DRAFT_1032468 [Mycena vitilis]
MSRVTAASFLVPGSSTLDKRRAQRVRTKLLVEPAVIAKRAAKCVATSPENDAIGQRADRSAGLRIHRVVLSNCNLEAVTRFTSTTAISSTRQSVWNVLKAAARALVSRGASMVNPHKSRRIKSLKVVQVTDLLSQAEANLEADYDHELVSAQIQSYRIALAPHKKLPPEVLAIIFANCVETPIILPPSPQEPALALASTCRSWRSIILSIPNLWNNIFLDFRGSKPVKLLEFAKLWLSRSNTLITLRNSTSRWTESRLREENVDPISYLVAPYSTRCREIDMRFLDASIDEFFTLPTGSIERLEVLYLETLGFTMPFTQTSGEPLDVFRSVLSLRRVLFSTDLCSLDPEILGLPWGQLTGLHFIATYIPPLAMHAILRESSSLLECSFSIIQLDDTLASALDRLPECVLPALQSLMVEFSPDTIDYASFLRPLGGRSAPTPPSSRAPASPSAGSRSCTTPSPPRTSTPSCAACRP